jgi:hypothetical protein
MMDNLTDDSGFITLEMVEELRAEIERLRERLEMYPVKLTTGEVDRGELLSESCDGIACRDETIKLQDAEIERLQTLLLATSTASFTNDTTSTASFTNDTSDEGDHT